MSDFDGDIFMNDMPGPEAEGQEKKVVPRPEHTVSRKNIDEEALKVLYRLHRHGHKAYLVGGGVRDLLLGRTPKDFDIATDARPSEVRALFRNSRTIGRRFRLVQVYFRGNKIVEVSTFRSKSEYDPKEPHVKRRENTFGTAVEDAFRRDLTINGLFYDIATFSLIDYIRGLDDLRDGIIRIIGDPETRILEDPVRMIRAIRHAARNDFRIEPRTLEAIRKHRREILHCVPARVCEEFLRLLRERNGAPSIELLIDTGLLFVLFPEYEQVLSPDLERSVGARNSLLKILGVIDARIRSGKSLNDAVIIAAFLTPLVHGLGIAYKAPRGRGRIPFIRGQIREVVVPVLSRLGTSRRNTDSACQLLGAQFILQRALGSGAVPKNLRQKSYYPAAIVLYEIGAAARGESLPRIFRETQPRDRDRSSRRRRRRRGRGRPEDAKKPV
ncbi:poly(A) polymerase, partial [Thermodesulfobacteriota bacterium]